MRELSEAISLLICPRGLRIIGIILDDDDREIEALR